jgi:DNA polymerase/3'-5' exonuclease PolX
MEKFIKDNLYNIVGNNNIHSVEVCGSYRRGKLTCGDMDVFITRKDGEYENLLLTKLV